MTKNVNFMQQNVKKLPYDVKVTLKLRKNGRNFWKNVDRDS